MGFGGFADSESGGETSEINMIPLIDVMLVLLIIFIISAPLLTHAVKLELPKVDSQLNQLEPDKIMFAIDAAGQRHWNGEPLTREQAAERFAIEGRRVPQPVVHLHVDHAAAYRGVAETLADASEAGLSKIGFVSAPTRP